MMQSNITQNSDLNIVEIQSQKKVSIFLTSLKDLEFKEYDSFWINEHKDSLLKFKWIKSGDNFSHTNWGSAQPKNDSGYDYISIWVNGNWVYRS